MRLTMMNRSTKFSLSESFQTAKAMTVPILSILGLATPLYANAKTCHDNYAYLTFFDENGNSLSLQNASASINGFDVTSGQSCGGPHMVNGPNWCTDSGGGCSDASRTNNNVVQVLYNAGRSKSSDMGTEFRSVTNNNPLFGLGLSEDQTEGSYSPDELNLWIQFNLSGVNMGNGRILSIPNISLAQGSETSSILALFNVIKDAAETVFYAFEEDIPESLKSYTELVGDSLDLEYENNWYASQPYSTSPSANNVYMTTYKGSAGLVIQGVDQNGDSYPVIIQDGGGDYNFTATILTGSGSATDLSNSKHLGNSFFFNPSIGTFQREPGTQWIRSIQLGRLYHLDLPDLSGGQWNWMYSEASDSWILWTPRYPGFFYQDLNDMIYQYDQNSMSFIKRPDLNLPADAAAQVKFRD